MRQRFLRYDTKSMIYIRNELDFLKISNLGSSEDTKKMNRLREDIFANHTSDNESAFRLHEELSKQLREQCTLQK